MLYTKQKLTARVRRINHLIEMHHVDCGTRYNTTFTLPAYKGEGLVFKNSGNRKMVMPTWYKVKGNTKADYWEYIFKVVINANLCTEWAKHP